MNLVVLSGRLTKDPEIRYANNESQTAIAHYTLAVNRGSKRDEADFIRITSSSQSAAFAEKYLRKGVKINVTGRIQTGSYTRENQKIFTTDVIVLSQEFCESKPASQQPSPAPSDNERFMNIPDGIDDELPFA